MSYRHQRQEQQQHERRSERDPRARRRRAPEENTQGRHSSAGTEKSKRGEYGEPRPFVRWQQDFPYIQFGVADAPLTDDTRSIDDSLQWPCPLCRRPILHGQTIFGLEGVPIHAECLDSSLDAVLRRKAKKIYMMRQRQKMLIDRELRRQDDGESTGSHERKSSSAHRHRHHQPHHRPPQPRGEPLRNVVRRVGGHRRDE